MSKPTAELDVIFRLINSNYLQHTFIPLFLGLHICYYKFIDTQNKPLPQDVHANKERIISAL